MDITDLKLKDKPELQKHVQYAEERIREHPPNSLLIITNVTDTAFDTQVAAIMGEYADHNTPYVKAGALVGISEAKKIVLTAIKAIVERDFYLADTMEEAQEWLAQQ